MSQTEQTALSLQGVVKLQYVMMKGAVQAAALELLDTMQNRNMPDIASAGIMQPAIGVEGVTESSPLNREQRKQAAKRIQMVYNHPAP